MCSKTGLNTLASGWLALKKCGTGRVDRRGRTELVTRECGATTRQMEEVHSGMCMGISTRVTGSTTKLRATESTLTLTVPNTKVSGKTTYRTDRA